MFSDIIEYIVSVLTTGKDHTTFHEKPLSPTELDQGYTRPYRWHMDTPFYARLPGEVTILHAVKVPNLADQKLKFPDGQEVEIAAGATACTDRHHQHQQAVLNVDLLTNVDHSLFRSSSV